MRVSLIIASATLAGAFGGAIAYGIAQMDYVSGLAAWRWLFILEGIPTIAFAPVVALLLPDYPETAGWLSEVERDRVQARLKGNGSLSRDGGVSWSDVKATVLNARLWVHYIVRYATNQTNALLNSHLPHPGILWHISALRQPVAFRTKYRRWPWLYFTPGSAFYRPSIRRGIRCCRHHVVLSGQTQSVRDRMMHLLIGPDFSSS